MSDWELTSSSSDSSNNKIHPETSSDWSLSEPKEESFSSKLPRNIGIGLTHAGRSLHNLPHDVAQGVDVLGSAIGRFFGAPELQHQNSNLASYFPYDTQNYGDIFGQKGEGTPTDKLIQKGIEYAPDIVGGLNLLRSMHLLPHLTRRGAARNLQRAREMGAERNIGNLDVNPNLIEDMRQYLPSNTEPYRRAMDAAHTGNYQSLFDLQSTAGKEAASRSRSLLDPAQRSFGRAGLQAREDLIQDMHRALQSQNHHDISNALRIGQDEYRRYMRFKPYRNAIGLTAAGLAIPKNALTDLIKKLALHNNQ